MSVLNLNWWPTSGQMQGIMGQGGDGAESWWFAESRLQ